MRKVKLTKEQAEAIEQLKNIDGTDALINAHAKNTEWDGLAAVLNGMPISRLSRALYIGYEIEPDCCRMCGSGGSPQLNKTLKR